MKKVVISMLAGVMLLASAAQAQWKFVKVFPDSSFLGKPIVADANLSGNHGLAIDPDGKIWVTFYEATDSVQYRAGRFGLIRMIYCFTPNGQQTSFSPIKFLNFGGVIDTVGGNTLANGTWSVNTNRGLNVDHEGNILASNFDRVLRINYKTGEGINKVNVGNGGSITAAAADANGNVYASRVSAGNQPLKIYDKDFNYIGNVVDSLRGFARTLAVTQNGLTVYWAGFSNHAIYKYTRPDEFSRFGKPDTVLKGMQVESMQWHPKTGHLWVSSGSGNNKPNQFPGLKTNWLSHTWYAYDTATKTVVDSISWFAVEDSLNRRPRAIAFSADGNTAYVAMYGGTGKGYAWPTIQMFRKEGVAVQERPANIPEGYALSQNFPNPFNPSTEIQFSIAKAGVTTLKIYDMLGKEVATLVNRHLPAGTHKFTFDASRLATGAYIYEMTSNGVRLSKKMSFMK